jgi:hypothetical protein
MTPNPLIFNTVALNTSAVQDVTFTNVYGAVTAGASGTSNLGSTFVEQRSINHLQQLNYILSVPAGLNSFTVKIGSPSDPKADLDLFVFDPSGLQVGASAGSTSEETVTINNPVTGDYTVVIDAYSVPAGTTTYLYRDTFTKAGYGTVTVTDAQASHPAGSTWNAPVSVNVTGTPELGRFLVGTIQVKSGTIVIGTGEVQVLSVTP